MQKLSHYLMRLLLAAAFCAGLAAQTPNYGVLAHLPAAAVAAFEARHTVQAVQLSPTRDLYLVTCNDGRTDAQLLQELLTDPVAGRPVLNAPVALGSDYQLNGTQSTASVLNGTQSTASVLNGTGSTSGGLSLNLGSGLNFLIGPGTLVGGLVNGVLNPLLGSVLNLNISVSGTGSATASGSGSLLSSAPTYFYGAVVPQAYPQQSVLNQVHAGNYALADGHGVEIALIDNGVDPNNPVLSSSLDWQNGYNFYDGSRDWSAYADLGTTPASGGGLAGTQSTASVLNGQSTASVLNGEPCAGGFGGSDGLAGYQSTASVLNGGQSTASVLNGDTSSGSVLTDLALLLTCDPDFGHGTSVAGVLHLVAPRATILPIKAFGPGGSASAATIYQAIAYAIDRHVQVMNLSFSALATTPDIADIVAEAVRDGIVVVAAAGNGSTSNAVYPAAFPGVVGTGALDGTQAGFPAASFSNFDPGPGQFVDVKASAPGVNLFTTYPGTGQIWATVSGSSFSTPLLAAEAALLAQQGRQGTGAVSLMLRTANPSIAGDASGGQGYGMVNIAAALQAADGWFWF